MMKGLNLIEAWFCDHKRDKKATTEEERERAKRGHFVAKHLIKSIQLATEEIAWNESLKTGANSDNVEIELYLRMLRMLHEYEMHSPEEYKEDS